MENQFPGLPFPLFSCLPTHAQLFSNNIQLFASEVTKGGNKDSIWNPKGRLLFRRDILGVFLLLHSLGFESLLSPCPVPRASHWKQDLKWMSCVFHMASALSKTAVGNSVGFMDSLGLGKDKALLVCEEMPGWLCSDPICHLHCFGRVCCSIPSLLQHSQFAGPFSVSWSIPSLRQQSHFPGAFPVCCSIPILLQHSHFAGAFPVCLITPYFSPFTRQPKNSFKPYQN